MKKILVTGGLGLVGSNFINHIYKVYPQYIVVNLDKSQDKCQKEHFNNAENKYKFIQGNISDRKFIFDLFGREKFDIVVNFAYERDVNKQIDNQSIFTTTNIVGTQNLLDACKKYNVSRYHQISTNEVYDDLEDKEMTSYVASKAAADLLVISYYDEHDLKTTISRSNDLYEKEDIKKYCKIIDDIIHEGVAGNIYNIVSGT
ncbi:MAG: GDP-mannose 4,6-dehydratase [Terrisporobacter sp.]